MVNPSEDDFAVQAKMYEAFLIAVKDVPWFKGVFWWDWSTDFAYGGSDNACMTP